MARWQGQREHSSQDGNPGSSSRLAYGHMWTAPRLAGVFSGPSDRILWAEAGHGTHVEKIASFQSLSESWLWCSRGQCRVREEHHGLSSSL